MVDEAAVQRVSRFLADKHLKPDASWIRDQLSALVGPEVRDSNNVIYKRILEADWKELANGTAFSKLPGDLDLKLFNEKKRVFSGSYVLQITDLVNISKAIADDKLANQFSDDEDDADNEEVSENELARLMKGKKTAATKKKETKKWSNGRRCLQLVLFDGSKQCVAIEYLAVPVLHENLLGAKVLLTGPFDVYAGVVLLRPQNLKVLSDQTFYPAPQNPQNARNPTQNPRAPSPNPQPVIELDDDDINSLLMDDFDDPFEDQIFPKVVRNEDEDFDCFLSDYSPSKRVPEAVPERAPERVPERKAPEVVEISDDYDSLLLDDDLDDL